tara:strand:- start:1322 stop:2041 length:720 start_codon:yes stop_codon:yes gene_type:complete
MSEQAGDITSYNRDKRTILDYFLLAGGWLLSFISLVIIGLITYWAIKIPEKNVNSLPIINAIKGNIRVEPAEPGGKSFDDKDLSIYKNLENGPKIPQKNEIILNKTDQNLVNLRKEIKTNKLIDSGQKDLTSAIEAALREVVNINLKENNQLERTNQQAVLKLYLGSFDTLSQAQQFKQFIKKRNESLLDINDLKIFEKLKGERKLFRVELTNIGSEEEGNRLCSILSRRQFSCIAFNE